MTPIEVARNQIGYREGPSNNNKFGRALGLNNEPWCALFVTWCYLTSGHKLPSMQPGEPTGYAGVFAGRDWAKANGLWRPSWEADPNDAIVYGGPMFPAGHTGLIVHAGRRGQTGATIEGNRGDAVRAEVFTVGADYVLGTIRLSAFLKEKIVIRHPAPDGPRTPQPRDPAHPSHTGPTHVQPRLTRQDRAALTRLLHAIRHLLRRTR